MKNLDADTPFNLSGKLLVAHPGLLDPNFVKTVILVSAHSDSDGALGVVINRPTGQTLGDLRDEFRIGPLADVPVYFGGPVNEDQMILAAWRWVPEDGIFRLYFGISPEKAESMLFSEPGIQLRGFAGYSGWSGGQLEGELAENAWIVSPIDGALIDDREGVALWREIVGSHGPELAFLADVPEDPSLN